MKSFFQRKFHLSLQADKPKRLFWIRICYRLVVGSVNDRYKSGVEN